MKLPVVFLGALALATFGAGTADADITVIKLVPRTGVAPIRRPVATRHAPAKLTTQELLQALALAKGHPLPPPSPNTPPPPAPPPPVLSLTPAAPVWGQGTHQAYLYDNNASFTMASAIDIAVTGPSAPTPWIARAGIGESDVGVYLPAADLTAAYYLVDCTILTGQGTTIMVTDIDGNEAPAQIQNGHILVVLAPIGADMYFSFRIAPPAGSVPPYNMASFYGCDVHSVN